MERSVNYYMLLLLLTHFLCFGYSETNKEAHGHVTQVNLQSHKEKLLEFKAPISTTQRDITTPITTIPNLVPTISTSPILNPDSNPDTYSPSSTVPITAPSTPNSPVSSGASWCIASPSASQRSLQVALDYACGYGGTDCSAIQPGGSCYNPNSVHDHASFAFNKYYQKNPVPNSCNFGGNAVLTNTNPTLLLFLNAIIFFLYLDALNSPSRSYSHHRHRPPFLSITVTTDRRSPPSPPAAVLT